MPLCEVVNESSHVCFEFQDAGLRFRVSGFISRVHGFGFRLQERFGARWSNLDGTPPMRAAKPFRVSGSQFRVQKIDFTLSGTKFLEGFGLREWDPSQRRGR